MSTKPKALLTNDDGIDSHFLHTLASTLSGAFDITVVAPLAEQSWIGKALSRGKTVHAAKVNSYPCTAWALDGTPCDCVNIALSHLLPEKPDIVISGINITCNVSIPLLFSSGTFGAAVEGSVWGIPSMATSHHIPLKLIPEIASKHGRYSPELDASVQAASTHILKIAQSLLEKDNQPLRVHNLNFPWLTNEDTEVVRCNPAENIHLGSLFTKESETSFRFQIPDELCEHSKPIYDRACKDGSDMATLVAGKISYSEIDFRQLTKSPAS